MQVANKAVKDAFKRELDKHIKKRTSAAQKANIDTYVYKEKTPDQMTDISLLNKKCNGMICETCRMQCDIGMEIARRGLCSIDGKT